MEVAASRFREIATSSLKVGAATVASLLGWVVGGKILAVELGAAGVGVFGLLRQLLQNLTLLSTFNGTTALVQGLASRSGERSKAYLWSVGAVFAAGALGVALVLIIGAPWIGPWLVPHPQSAALTRWLAIAVVATTAQAFFTGVLNGNSAVNALVRSQLLAPVAVLAAALPMARLVQRGSPSGYVLMLAIPGAAVAIGAMLQARRCGWLAPACDRRPSGADAASFLRMSGVLLVSGLMTTGTQYLQSRMVAAHLGLNQVGVYWVAWTLSMSYVTILLSSYGTYYMPALTGLKERAAQHALIRDYLKLALLVMPVVVSGVVLLKPVIIRVMFSQELKGALSVMRWMLVGDLFKGIAWVLSFPMLAFNELRWFFWTEAIFNLLMLALAAAWLAAGGGIEQLGTLFMIMYAVYLGAMGAYIRLEHRFQFKRAEIVTFFAGLALVACASAVTWRDEEIRLMAVAVSLACAGVFALVASGAYFSARAKPAPRAVVGNE